VNDFAPFPASAEDAHPPLRSLSKGLWILAYSLSLALPFVCLRYARAIGTGQCVLGVLAGLIVQVGMIPIMAAAEGNPLQMFVLALLGFSYYVIVLWQHLAGRKVGLWSEAALYQWRLAGIFFGALLGLTLGAGIVMFNLQQAMHAHG
jgi:hypothetical protein